MRYEPDPILEKLREAVKLIEGLGRSGWPWATTDETKNIEVTAEEASVRIRLLLEMVDWVDRRKEKRRARAEAYELLHMESKAFHGEPMPRSLQSGEETRLQHRHKPTNLSMKCGNVDMNAPIADYAPVFTIEAVVVEEPKQIEASHATEDRQSKDRKSHAGNFDQSSCLIDSGVVTKVFHYKL